MKLRDVAWGNGKRMTRGQILEVALLVLLFLVHLNGCIVSKLPPHPSYSYGSDYSTARNCSGIQSQDGCGAKMTNVEPARKNDRLGVSNACPAFPHVRNCCSCHKYDVVNWADWKGECP